MSALEHSSETSKPSRSGEHGTQRNEYPVSGYGADFFRILPRAQGDAASSLVLDTHSLQREIGNRAVGPFFKER